MSTFIRKYLVLLLIVGLGMPMLSAGAQRERTALAGDYSVIAPEGWTKSEASQHGTLFTNGDSTLTLFDPNQMVSLKSDSSNSNLKELLVTIFDQTHDFKADLQAVENQKFNDYDAALWDYTLPDKPDMQAEFIVFQLDTERYAALDITSPKAAFDASLKAASEMVGSLTTDQELAGLGAQCFVSTEAERSVTLRVGPGVNRGSVTFLPAGVNFTVLGQATDKGGKVWFKLDKNAAAPKSAANQVWVLSNDVTTSGNCGSLEAVPTPVINRPLPTPGPTGGNAGSSAGGTVPKAGNWTISYASTAPGSCLDAPGYTVQFPINIPPDTVTVSNPTGSSLVFDGDTFVTIQPGVYQGLYDSLFSDRSVLLTLRVINDSVMTTEFIFNLTVQGTQCSITVNGTATRN